MFCKKCQKKIVKLFKSFHELKNICICEKDVFFEAEKTEMKGIKNGSHIAKKLSKTAKKTQKLRL